MKKTKLLYLLPMALLACRSKEVKKPTPTQEEVLEINRLSVRKEKIRIEQYAERMNWPVKSTGSGLYYHIYEHGSGDSVTTGSKITARIVVSLLSGDTCYNWQKDGEKSFTVDYDHNESGLHEAVKLMRAGDKAKLILPQHLAFGVAGDFKCIPSNSSVVYDFQLIAVKN